MSGSKKPDRPKLRVPDPQPIQFYQPEDPPIPLNDRPRGAEYLPFDLTHRLALPNQCVLERWTGPNRYAAVDLLRIKREEGDIHSEHDFQNIVYQPLIGTIILPLATINECIALEPDYFTSYRTEVAPQNIRTVFGKDTWDQQECVVGIQPPPAPTPETSTPDLSTGSRASKRQNATAPAKTSKRSRKGTRTTAPSDDIASNAPSAVPSSSGLSSGSHKHGSTSPDFLIWVRVSNTILMTLIIELKWVKPVGIKVKQPESIPEEVSASTLPPSASPSPHDPPLYVTFDGRPTQLPLDPFTWTCMEGVYQTQWYLFVSGGLSGTTHAIAQINEFYYRMVRVHDIICLEVHHDIDLHQAIGYTDTPSSHKRAGRPSPLLNIADRPTISFDKLNTTPEFWRHPPNSLFTADPNGSETTDRAAVDRLTEMICMGAFLAGTAGLDVTYPSPSQPDNFHAVNEHFDNAAAIKNAEAKNFAHKKRHQSPKGNKSAASQDIVQRKETRKKTKSKRSVDQTHDQWDDSGPPGGGASGPSGGGGGDQPAGDRTGSHTSSKQSESTSHRGGSSGIGYSYALDPMDGNDPLTDTTSTISCSIKLAESSSGVEDAEDFRAHLLAADVQTLLLKPSEMDHLLRHLHQEDSVCAAAPSPDLAWFFDDLIRSGRSLSTPEPQTPPSSHQADLAIVRTADDSPSQPSQSSPTSNLKISPGAYLRSNDQVAF